MSFMMPILILIWSLYMGAFFDGRINFSVLFNWYDYDKLMFFYIIPKLFLFYVNEIFQWNFYITLWKISFVIELEKGT